MRSIESKHGLTYIMGREIQFVDSLKEFGTLYKSKLDENQLYIAEELRRRDIIKLVKLISTKKSCKDDIKKIR